MGLARRDWEEFRDFYSYLGIGSACIEAGSEANSYVNDGINYSNVANASLFEARTRLEGKVFPAKRALVIDESDFALLDDTTNYRYAVDLAGSLFAGTESSDAWVYDALNDFIDTPEFNVLDGIHAWSPEEDIDQAIIFLQEVAGSNPRKLQLIADLKKDRRRLNVWLDSAISAKRRFDNENTDYVIREEERLG